MSTFLLLLAEDEREKEAIKTILTKGWKNRAAGQQLYGVYSSLDELKQEFEKNLMNHNDPDTRYLIMKVNTDYQTTQKNVIEEKINVNEIENIFDMQTRQTYNAKKIPETIIDPEADKKTEEKQSRKDLNTDALLSKHFNEVKAKMELERASLSPKISKIPSKPAHPKKPSPKTNETDYKWFIMIDSNWKDPKKKEIGISEIMKEGLKEPEFDPNYKEKYEREDIPYVERRYIPYSFDADEAKQLIRECNNLDRTLKPSVQKEDYIILEVKKETSVAHFESDAVLKIFPDLETFKKAQLSISQNENPPKPPSQPNTPKQNETEIEEKKESTIIRPR